MAINDFFAEDIATELLKTLMTIICKSCLCKSSAKDLSSTIDELLPIIQEIKCSGVELPQIRQVQLDRLSETLGDGLKLCNEVLSSAWWNVYKNFRLVRKMKKLEKKVAGFLNGPMQAHVLADIHHMRNEIAERFDRLEQRLGLIWTSHGDLPAREGISRRKVVARPLMLQHEIGICSSLI